MAHGRQDRNVYFSPLSVLASVEKWAVCHAQLTWRVLNAIGKKNESPSPIFITASRIRASSVATAPGIGLQATVGFLIFLADDYRVALKHVHRQTQSSEVESYTV